MEKKLKERSQKYKQISPINMIIETSPTDCD
jgi:hypothetical protein